MGESAPRGEDAVRSTGDGGKESSGYTCRDCGKVYDYSSNLVDHYKGNNPCSGLECPTCGMDHFTSKRGLKQHHSKKHGVRLEAKDSDVVCPTCGSPDFINETGMRIHHKKVHGESIAGVMKDCEWCGEPFQTYPSLGYRFCGSKCRREWKKVRYSGSNHPLWRGGPTIVNCSWCGEELERNRCAVDNQENFFCNRECHGNWRSENIRRENHWNWSPYTPRSPLDYGPNWDEQRFKALLRDQYRCQVCRKTPMELGRDPDVHHIRRMAKFRKQYDAPEWYEEGNRLTNLICYCRSCHPEWEGIPLRPEFSP